MKLEKSFQKSAIVTGASSGIGLEIVKKLLKTGRKVFGIGRIFRETIPDDPCFVPIICDLTDISALCKQITKIRSEETIDVLINNAGTGYFGPHDEQNSSKIHEMVTVNLEIPMVITQLLLRDLKHQSGYIINISSITAKKINTHGCAYGATKAGLSSFTQSLFEEVRKYGVTVSLIHPDMTKTNFYRNADFEQGITEDTYLFPAEIADAVEYILLARKGLVISEITLQPQKHQIYRKKSKNEDNNAAN